MIYLKECNLFFGSQPILDSVSLSCMPNQRIGLVGKNGSGKTTFLKVIAKQQLLDSGLIQIPSNFQVAYLPQEVVLDSTQLILEEALAAFPEVPLLRSKSKELEQLLETATSAELVEEYGFVMHKMLELNVEALEGEALKILTGLGFTEELLKKQVNQLSTGWKMRLLLAKLLLKKADFYLFDEPTNHLDIFAKEWLISFLKKASFGFLIVCHERYVLDELCSHIFELDRGEGTLFAGNYSSYEEQREHNKNLLESSYITQQKELKRKQKTIDAFRYTPSKAKMVQSMIKSLEKIERIELDSPPKAIAFSFQQNRNPGRTVLTVKNLAFGFNENVLFEKVSFDIERGEKVALIAPNGKGKTTLFNVLRGAYQQKRGTIEFGYNVDYAFFAQDYNNALDLSKTILDQVMEEAPNQTMQRVRSVLGAFLFRKEDVNKKIEVLSGGEKNRVRMVIALLQNANFLILDEPTNHLDIESKDILIQALSKYEGTLLFVSHDVEFINALATRVLELHEEGIESFSGNYNDYKYYKNLHDLPKQPKQSIKGDASALKEYRKKQNELEKQLERIEKHIHTQKQLLETEQYSSTNYMEQYNILLQLERDQTTIYEEWDKIVQAIDLLTKNDHDTY